MEILVFLLMGTGLILGLYRIVRNKIQESRLIDQVRAPTSSRKSPPRRL